MKLNQAIEGMEGVYAVADDILEGQTRNCRCSPRMQLTKAIGALHREWHKAQQGQVTSKALFTILTLGSA